MFAQQVSNFANLSISVCALVHSRRPKVFLKASPKGKGTAGPTNLSLAQALPFDVLVKIGETHFANSEVIRPLCSCIDLQAVWLQEVSCKLGQAHEPCGE